jgi:hypothetical protein
MINPQRKYRFHARLPLGISPPGIGPAAEPGWFARNAHSVAGGWHPAARIPSNSASLESKKSTVFKAWSISRGQTP